jgi:glycine hydroxymethyltransferase
MIPFDQRSPFVTSGIRLGTPAVTTRGMQEREMTLIADMISRVLSNIGDEEITTAVRKEVELLCKKYPLDY